MAYFAGPIKIYVNWLNNQELKKKDFSIELTVILTVKIKCMIIITNITERRYITGFSILLTINSQD